ncbi:MAG: PKD domain-containing protein [Bacteroidales bacterium]
MTGRVYIAVLSYVTTTNFTGATIKGVVLSGTGGGWVAVANLPVNAGNVGLILQSILDLQTANHSYSVFFAAESNGGVIQIWSTRVNTTTPPCPKIDILTGFTQPVTCVNQGAIATFQTVILDPATSGILKGTQWSMDWGDGTTVTYTSTADNNLPTLALRTHTYTTATTCNYVFSNTVRNPCGETRSVQYVAVVHGRDIPSDGDGMLSIVNNANGSSTIQVCEGSQSIVTLLDNSTWNCQSPVLPGGLTPVPNLDTRNIEWLYGRDPAGVVYNTITGTVNIASLGSAPQFSGRMVPSPYSSNSLSQAITIPATARAGQYFRVYLKNWNKCNWGDPEFVSTYVDIEVVAAPPAPTAPNLRVCVGEDRTLTVTSIPVGTISWYRDAALTNLLGTGASFVPPDVAAGTYTYYATDRFLSGIQCQSAGTPVVLTIDPLPQKPTISAPNKNSICYDSCRFELYTMTALPAPSPAITSYQWYMNGIAIPGETNQSITLCKPEHSGFYTVSAVGPAPSYCPGPQSDPWEVTVHTLSNLTNPVPAVICQGQTATFSAWTTDEVQTWQWEYSMDGGVNFTTVSQGGPFNGFNTPNLTITNPPPSWNGYLFRVEIKTPPGQGGCWFKSKAAPLIVDVVPAADAGPNISICTPTPFNPVYMTGTTTTGTYASAIWTGGDGLGTWTQNSNPALAYFTPSVPSASFTATLTVTATTSCGGMVITDTRQIRWSQTPAVEAGPNISRCDNTPLAPFTMTGASATGTYSALSWTGGTGLGTWTQNTDPALAVFTPSVPNGSFTATLSAIGSEACPGTNPVDTRTITWGQTPLADAGPDIALCTTTPLAPIPMTNASTGGTYSGLSWSGGASYGTWTQNANPALATFTPSVTNGSFVAMLTVNGTGACTGSNATDTRVIEWSYAATVNAGPDQGICAMASAILAGSIGGSATSATWSGGAGTFAPNNTTLNAVYTPSPAERAAQSVTLTLTTNDPAGICLPVNDQVTISIGTMPTAAILTSSGDACFGVAASWLNIAVTGGGDPYVISYTLNGTPRPNITTYYNDTHFNLGILPVGTYTYAITQIRDNCGNILSGAGINPVTFQIYQNPVANAGGDQAFCGILTANLAAVPSIGIGTWSVVSGPGTVTFSPDVNNPNASITAMEYGSYVLRWTEVNGGMCVSASDKTVLFERTANGGSDMNLCGTLAATLAGNAPAVGQGTWTLVSGPGTVSFTPTANTPNATATVSAYGAYVFRWTMRNSVFCFTEDEVTVVYNPAGQVNKPADMFVCTGDVTSGVTFTTVNTGGITTYRWTNDNINIGLAASGDGNLPSFIATNPGASPVTATITITPTYTNGTTVCPGPPVTFTITVNPAGQVDQPVNRIACENNNVSVAFTTVNTGGTTTYNWTNSNTGIGLQAAGSGDISFIATNTASVPITGTITVTPVFINGGTSCPGPSRTFNITINPEGQVDEPADMIICNGTTQNVVFTTVNTNGLTTFSWTNSNTAIGLGTDGTGPLTFTATNTGTSPITATITVSPSFNNGSVDCAGPSETFTITVNPTPVLSSPLTIPDICSNSVVSYNPASTTSGTTFSWTRGVVAGITPDGPTFGTDNPGETLRNLTNITIGVTYQFTLTANGCPNIQNVFVNVKPEPVIEPDQTSDVCSDNAVNHHISLVNFSNPSDNVTFTWPAPELSPADPAFSGGTARTSASIQNISDVFTNRTGLTGTATYTVTPYKDGCAGVPETIVIVVRPEPVLDPDLNRTICSNTPIGLILREAAGSIGIDYYNISDVRLDDGLSADPGNSVISNSAAPAGYLENDRYLNITGVNKNVTYTVQPFRTPDCFGDPVEVVITIRPQPYIVPAQIKSVCSGVPIAKEILLSPANVPAGTVFSWPAPTMSDASGQGTAGVNVTADPAGKLHINDIINNTSGVPVTATYNITPISAEGCAGLTIPVIITINPEPLPRIISGRDKICIGETNIVYNVSPVPGSSFHWTVDPAVGTKTFDYNTNAIIINAASAAGSGIISVYETNLYTCAADSSILPVQVYTQASPENISGPADVCAFSTQTYSVTPRTGSTYKWSIPGGAAISGDPSAATINVVFGNVGGTISVSETNIAGCITNHNPITVTVRPLPSASISGGANICEGGSIPLNVVFSGTAPYSFTYAVNGVAQVPVTTSSNPYVLNATLAGTYTIVNVTDATGCTNTGSGTALVTYFIRPTGTITGGGEICRGGSEILTFVFTGTAPFTFTYNDGTTNLTVPNWANTVYNLSVSPTTTLTYTLVSLTDGHSCNGSVSGSAVVTVNDPPALTLSGADLTCYRDNSGSIDLTVTGNSPFGFAWSGPGGFTAGTEDIAGLGAGTYYLTVTDTKGCISTGSVTLTEPGPVNAMLNYTEITCFGAAEGEIEISLPVGGSGIYEYTIDGGTTWVTTGLFTGLTPGTYDVRMRDAMSPVCFRILNGALVLTGPDQLNATVTPADIICYGADNGSIVISGPSGGSGIFGFSTDGGSSWHSSGNFTNLEPGTYSVWLRDATQPGCFVILNPELLISEPPQLNAAVESTNISCFGSTDGTITVSAPSGGHGTYEFSVNGGGSWQLAGNYTGLGPGTYNVQIRDAAYPGCYRVLNGALLITQPAVLRATFTTTMVTCFGANDGIITFSNPSGGSGTFEFSIDGGVTWQSSGSFQSLAPGSYSLMIRDLVTNACEIVVNNSVDITEPPALSGTIMKYDITCFGASDGRIMITNSGGGHGSYEYTINGGVAAPSWQTSNSFTGLSQGTYNVQMRDRVRTNCVLILDPALVINEPAVLTANVSGSNVSCFNANDGTISIAGESGGSGSYQYSINGGTSWTGVPVFMNLVPGSYDVRIRDAVNTNCSLIINPNLIIIEPEAITATVQSTNITCNGANDGTITISSPAGGYGTYEYSINGTAWQASGSFTALSPGYYSVQIRDAAHTGCVTILNGSLRITEPAILRATLQNTNVTCFGADDGTITITSPAGGYGTYEYSINGGGSWQLAGNFSNLVPGTYDVRMRDAAYHDCFVILNNSLVITEQAILAATVSSVNVTCFGADNGTISITSPSGGYGTYEYSIDGGTTWSGTGAFSNLEPGTYSVWLRDATQPGCFVILNPELLITEPAILTATVTGSNVTCFGASDGSVSITNPSGGYGTYEYSINGGGSWHSSGLFTGLVPGNYNVRIRDAANITCFIVLNSALQITQPPVLNATVSAVMITCNGANDGRIDITSATGGYGTYEYSVSGGGSWQLAGSFGNLAPGIYNVRIRDAVNNDCVIILNSALPVTQPAVLNAGIVSANITCFGANDGAISVTNPSGGYGTYEYSVNGGSGWQMTGTFSNLAPGTYDVRIRDRANILCVITLDPALSITEPAALSAGVTSTDVTCFGANNGTITITGAAGGYGTYQYSVDGGTYWQPMGTFSNLMPGTYDVRIRDAANPACVMILDPAVIITQPDALNATSNSTAIACYGSTDGTITITNPSGGYGIYEYSINGGATWQSAAGFSNLAPGTYQAMIRDASDITCVFVLPAALTITEPAALNALVAGTNITCLGAGDGTITISSPTGGYGTYEYTINGGGSWQASGIFTGLGPGTYNVQMRDALYPHCTRVLMSSLSVTQPAMLNAMVTWSMVTCFGANNGSITISSPTGGYGSFEYSVGGVGSWQLAGSFGNLAPGTYVVRMRDAGNPDCVTILNPSLAITEPDVLNATVSSTNVTCYGANDGRILITYPSGGYGSYEYSIDGTAWQSTGSFQGLAPGTYNLFIRDKAHPDCVVILDTAAEIMEAVILNATVTGIDVTCFGATDGSIQITDPSGGSGSYLYSINGGASWQGWGVFNNLAVGTYDVRIRDAATQDCIITLNPSLAIGQPAQLAAAVGSANVTCYGGNDGTITISVATGGYGTYEYSVNGGGSWQLAGSFTNLTPGSYNILVRDAAYPGCMVVLDNAFVLTQPDMLKATVSKTDVSCNGYNDGTITITSPSGGYGTYEYSVDTAGGWQSEGTFSNLAPGAYVVRMRDAANPDCSSVIHPNLVITGPLTLAMSSTGDITLNCYDDHDGMGTFYVYGGTMPYTFVLVSNTTGGTISAPGFNSQTFFNAGAGSITVSVVDNNGCSAQATINVTQPALLTQGSIASDQVVCFGDNPVTITESLAPSGGPDAYIYQWQYSANAAGPFMNIPSAISATFTPPAGATYTLYYRRVVTSGLCEAVYSNVVEILVNPLPIAIFTGGATICPGESSVLRVNLPAGTGPFTLDIENHGTVSNYFSGNDIVLTPAATTTYRLLSVRDANNCEVIAPSANLNGMATVIVSTLPSITSFTPSPEVCEYSLAAFAVTAEGTNLTYQWYVNEGSEFVPVADGGTYFGALTPTLQIFNSVRTMNGYTYHVVVSGCGNSVTSPDAVLTVNTAAEITQMPQDTTICMGQDAAFEADAQGTSVTWQWYVNKGAGFVPAVDDSYISGSNSRTLTITNAQGSFNNWYFRATADGICGAPTSTNLAVLRVLTPPQVTLQPINRTLCDGGNTSFQANGRGYLSMHWQVYTGGVWTDLTEDAVYLGTGSQMLNIVGVTNDMNGNQFRLALTGSCMTVYSDPATLVVNGNPVVDFTAVDPVPACGGVPVTLDGNPSGGSGTYTGHNWTGDIGPLNNYYTQTPEFNAMMAGDYSLNYRVTDSNGCQASGDVTVRVDVPSAQFAQDISFGCTPLDVTFTKDMAGIAKWWWDFGDGSPVDSLNAAPLHTFANLSDGMIEYYDVSLRVQSAAGCYDEVLSGITVFPGVDASFAPDADVICSGSPVTFTALPGAGRYFWDYGDGISGYSTNVSNHIYTNNTTVPVVRTVTLVTTSFYNCTDVRTYDITVMTVPVAQFTADPVTQVFDPAGTNVIFTNTTNEGTWDWLWRFGDNTTSVEKDPVHQYGDVGTYYVTLIAGNGICYDSITRFITIVPPAPVAIFDPVESGCAPLELSFNNTSLNTEAPGTTYRWDFGDGSTSTAKNPSYTYFDAGDYRIELTVTGPGGVSVMSRIVSSYSSPQAHFSLTPATVYANDVSVRFFNLTTGGSSFLWDFGDGDTSKVKDPSHKYMTEGIYDVTLWAYSENGCVDSYIISPAVTVLPVGDIRYPTAFTPNKNGPIDRTDLPTGGTDVDQFFYPAIRQEVVKYKLQIFNRWGVLIFESHDIHVPWNGYYKGELCPQGVYVWLVEGKYQDGKPFKKVGNVTLLQ